MLGAASADGEVALRRFIDGQRVITLATVSAEAPIATQEDYRRPPRDLRKRST